MAASGPSRQPVQHIPQSNSRQMTGASLNRCLSHDLRESREPTRTSRRWRSNHYRDYIKGKSRSLPRRFSDPANKAQSHSLTKSLSLLIRRLRPKSLRRNRRNTNESDLKSCPITLLPQQEQPVVQETLAAFENDTEHQSNRKSSIAETPLDDVTIRRESTTCTKRSTHSDHAQPSVSKRNSRSSMISKTASRSSGTASSIYNTFASTIEDDDMSVFETTRKSDEQPISLSITKQLSCGHRPQHACIEKDQQMDNKQLSQNVDGINANKQQAIFNRNAPNERRNSRSSSIHTCSDTVVQPSSHDESGTSSDDDQAAFEYIKLTAERLWNEDDGVCERARMAEWLGTNDRFRSNVLKQYMNNFDFGQERIDDAFRTLCSKMYLKAEAQQIDRVLEVFASRYWECNPTSLMRSADVIHAIAYSLLLLNTDLHGVLESHKKMTRAKFIRNTMATVCDLLEPQFDDLDGNKTTKRRGIIPMSESVLSAISSASTASSRWMPRRSISYKSMNSVVAAPGDQQFKHKGNSTSAAAPDNNPDSLQSWQQDIEELLRELYSSVKAKQIIQTSPSKSSMDDLDSCMDKKALLRRRRGQSLLSPLARLYISNDDPPFDQRRISHSSSSSFCANDNTSNRETIVSEKSVKSQIQVRKEGIVMQKHVMERHNKKARHRGWQPCILKVSEGKADLCRPDAGFTKDQKRKSFVAILGNHYRHSHINDFQHYYNDKNRSSVASTQGDPIVTIDLKHAIANSLPPPGWHGERHHVFSLQTSDGSVWLFESHDLESTLEWVTCCNYWSALLSKESLPGAVCNLDFGWNIAPDTADNDTECKLSSWITPVPSFVASSLPETDKVETLEKHISSLHHEIKQHRQAREHIYKRFTGLKSSHNKSTALDNWESKMQYLLHEIIKYRTYRDTLKCSIPSHISIS